MSFYDNNVVQRSHLIWIEFRISQINVPLIIDVELVLASSRLQKYLVLAIPIKQLILCAVPIIEIPCKKHFDVGPGVNAHEG